MPPKPPTPSVQVARLRAVGAADTLGRRLVIGRQVGAGGMGRVHEAHDEESGRKLAVKLIQQVRDEADLARFTAEAEILEALDHPAIVSHVAHGTTPDGDHYLAMEWLDGEHLGLRLARGRLPLADALALGRRIADGLAAAHGAGVVHRDLKPSNIVLVEGDVARATLVDFGIARRSGGDGLTRTGELVGTPGYMAPEQARGVRDVDGRADLFALGCVLYHAVAGAPPFHGDEVMTVLAKLLLEEAPPLRTACPDVPPRLDRLVARLLAKNPTRRPASAAAVAAELAVIADAEARGERPRLRDQRRRVALAAGGLGIGAAAIGAWLLAGGDAAPLPDPAAAVAAGQCVARTEPHTDPVTGSSWNRVTYCNNDRGAPLYAHPRADTQIATMETANSWFVCYRRGEPHAGGNDVWYYTQGDRIVEGWRARRAWGYMPAARVRASTDPYPGIPPCNQPHRLNLHVMYVTETARTAEAVEALMRPWIARAELLLAPLEVEIAVAEDDIEIVPASTLPGDRDPAMWTSYGNIVAERHQTEIVVFVRAGGNDACWPPTSYDFVSISPDGSNDCGAAKEDALARALGYFLGVGDPTVPITVPRIERFRRRLAERGL